LSAAEKEAVEVFLIEKVEREKFYLLFKDELSFVQSVLMEAEEQQSIALRRMLHMSLVFVSRLIRYQSIL